jgi:isomerase DpgB
MVSGIRLPTESISMSAVPIKLNNRTVLKIEIDGSSPLSKDLITRLDKACDEAEDRGPRTVMLFHIVGKRDLPASSEWPGNTSTQLVNKWERLLRRIERAGVTTIALVEYACSALALELLLVADVRLISGCGAIRHALAGGNVWPSMALYRLSRQIGEARARKLYLDGTDLTARQAMELNVADGMVNDLAGGLEHIAHLVTNSPLDDFAVRRRLMQDSLSTSFDEALGAHLAACDRALRRTSTSADNVAVEQEATSTV